MSNRTLNVSNSSLLWTKALACKKISTITLFVLLITNAHICEMSDTLSVQCHRTHARAFTFLPVFPWRVTYGKRTVSKKRITDRIEGRSQLEELLKKEECQSYLRCMMTTSQDIVENQDLDVRMEANFSILLFSVAKVWYILNGKSSNNTIWEKDS